jgi:hypothetical protein
MDSQLKTVSVDVDAIIKELLSIKDAPGKQASRFRILTYEYLLTRMNFV